MSPGRLFVSCLGSCLTVWLLLRMTIQPGMNRLTWPCYNESRPSPQIPSSRARFPRRSSRDRNMAGETPHLRGFSPIEKGSTLVPAHPAGVDAEISNFRHRPCDIIPRSAIPFCVPMKDCARLGVVFGSPCPTFPISSCTYMTISFHKHMSLVTWCQDRRPGGSSVPTYRFERRRWRGRKKCFGNVFWLPEEVAHETVVWCVTLIVVFGSWHVTFRL